MQCSIFGKKLACPKPPGSEPERRKAMSHTMTNCNESPTFCDSVQSARPQQTQAAATVRPRRQHALWALALAAATALALAGVALAGEYHSNPWLLSWIPATCCVTNDLCMRLRQCRQALGQAPGCEYALPVRTDALGRGVLPKAAPGALTRSFVRRNDPVPAFEHGAVRGERGGCDFVVLSRGRICVSRRAPA